MSIRLSGSSTADSVPGSGFGCLSLDGCEISQCASLLAGADTPDLGLCQREGEGVCMAQHQADAVACLVEHAFLYDSSDADRHPHPQTSKDA